MHRVPPLPTVVFIAAPAPAIRAAVETRPADTFFGLANACTQRRSGAR